MRTRMFEVVHWDRKEPPLPGLKPNEKGLYIVELSGDEILDILDTHNIKFQRQHGGRGHDHLILWVAKQTENFKQK